MYPVINHISKALSDTSVVQQSATCLCRSANFQGLRAFCLCRSHRCCNVHHCQPRCCSVVQDATCLFQLCPGDQLLAQASATSLCPQTAVQKVWGCNVGHPGAPGFRSRAVKLGCKAKYDSRQVVCQDLCPVACTQNSVKAGRWNTH